MDLTNSNFPSRTENIDKTSNNVISQKPSVKSYATKVFQESTIGVLSSIVTTSSRYRRFFKLLLLSLCVSGFLYQCITFLSHVFEYPTVVNIAVERSDAYNIPAYTFCNNNAIKRGVFCSMYPEHCVESSEEFCKKFSSYCGANTTLIPKEMKRTAEEYMPYEEILINGSLDFLTSDSGMTFNQDEPTGPFFRINPFASEAMICYSLHSVVENNQQPVKMERKLEDGYKFSSAVKLRYPEDTLIFYIDESEMMNPKRRPGILFALHSPFEFVNPFENGIFLEGGRNYKIYVEMQEEILLKAPFESNCVDYEDLWEKNNHTGPRTQKMCQNKCRSDYFDAVDQCANLYVLFPSKERICEIDHQPNSTVDEYKERIKRGKCFENCQNDCRLTKYTTEISMRYDIEEMSGEILHRFIVVQIFLPNDGIKVMKHSPKYVAVEVFSSIGGFIGCWLGIALLDILDFFGSIFTVCRYAFRKRL